MVTLPRIQTWHGVVRGWPCFTTRIFVRQPIFRGVGAHVDFSTMNAPSTLLRLTA